jgi:glucose-6-phosphate 1-dehydrogenase
MDVKELNSKAIINDVVHAKAPDIDRQPDECQGVRRGDPFTIVIVGATGDLTERKLIPALFNLYVNNGLPKQFQIVGCGRTRIDAQEFRQKMENAVGPAPGKHASWWRSFQKAIHYFSVEYDDLDSFNQLAEFLKRLDQKYHTQGNTIFYLALPPSLYQTVAQSIGRTGLADEKGNNGWSRIVVEKPFGRDLETAVHLDHCLNQFFQEHQIFRIDHYLAKETVQNILMFRFANTIFEPIWNRRYIDHIKITAIETLGVEHRAGYYEQAGVIRDMFQNHMMQLLALTAMEPPSQFEANQVRDEKAKIFRSLRPFPVANLYEYLVLGQYGAGTIDGISVPAYRDEPDVNPESLTPTFAKMRVFIDNWRWQNVPFVLASGKRLAQKRTEISIQFKEVPHSIFRRALGETIVGNQLILGIYPEEKITLTFQTKQPGAKVCLHPVTMDFFYNQHNTGSVLDAYEKVLIDCMLGEQMLFWRQDGVELSWSFLTPILEACETCDNREDMLQIYDAGRGGPTFASNK